MSVRALHFEKRWFVIGGLIVITGIAWGTRDRWWNDAQRQLGAWSSQLSVRGGKASEAPSTGGSHADDSNTGHSHAGHDHAGHNETTSLELSEQAQKNIGLKVGRVRVSTFLKTITVPGIVTEQRGWTKTRIVAPLTGIVTKVHVVEGQAVRPGDLLFNLRLTHEDLVQSQVEFLKIVEELDVVNREVDRLQPLSEKGAIPQKTLLDRLYEKQKLEAALRAQRESLLLHGLSAEQVEEIFKSRSLRSNLTVSVPMAVADSVQTAATEHNSRSDAVYIVEEMNVETGRLVSAGDQLLMLADYSRLYIEGNAFEQDGQLVADALQKEWKVTAVVENHTPAGTTVPDLSILYLSDHVDPVSRTLHFYLPLPNERIRDAVTNGRRFINWRYKPGQRTNLRVPVEEWSDRIVLPAEAVAQDGPETFVFQQNGDHFDRRPVQVEYRDLVSAVISQDGSLFPGDRVALSGAQQMLMALKNKAGGGIDPHAGHNH